MSRRTLAGDLQAAHDAAGELRQLVHFQLVSFLWRHRDTLQLLVVAALLGGLLGLILGGWWLW